MIGHDSKVTFQTFTRARQAAAKMRRKKDEVIEAYRCKECEKFHVGHPSTESLLLRHGRRVDILARSVGTRESAEESYR